MAIKAVGTLPRRIDLQFVKGDDLFLMVWVRDPDSGDLVDLGGSTVRSELRQSVPPDGVVVPFMSTVSAVAGRVDLHLPASDTATLEPRAATVWAFRLIDPAGRASTLCAGSVRITEVFW